MGDRDVPARREDRQGARRERRHARLRPQARTDGHSPVDHDDHVGLIRDAVTPGGTWLELGSGTGAFTLALADLLGPGGTIHSVDSDRGALATQAAAVHSRFDRVRLDQRTADFTRPLGFSGMDGVLMANALHFVKAKPPVLALVRGYLKPGGTFVLVEYDADRGNLWVPHPISFTTWLAVAPGAGFRDTRLLGRVPSRFLDAIYAAASRVDRPLDRLHSDRSG